MTDPETLAAMDIPAGETVVEIPTGCCSSSGGRILTPVSDDEFADLLSSGFATEVVHLETRDAYGTAVELPYMARWAAGEPDDLAWLQGWCATLREHAAAGRSVRRASTAA